MNVVWIGRAKSQPLVREENYPMLRHKLIDGIYSIQEYHKILISCSLMGDQALHLEEGFCFEYNHGEVEIGDGLDARFYLITILHFGKRSQNKLISANLEQSYTHQRQKRNDK
mmetsp:Transcript_31237/g.58452  ORF Transcript_31237/g.58452 Transcript_31237/m.58452 type:complete len:113 (-) Transcript_31237:45-383(-)